MGRLDEMTEVSSSSSTFIDRINIIMKYGSGKRYRETINNKTPKNPLLKVSKDSICLQSESFIFQADFVAPVDLMSSFFLKYEKFALRAALSALPLKKKEFE